MVSFLESFLFFKKFFAQNSFNGVVESISACFLEFYFLAQRRNFAWAITFGKWPIFKMVLFLEYLVFFRGSFCTELL